MNIKLSLVIESEEGTYQTEHEVVQLQRNALTPDTLGLTLSESKQLLHSLQQVIVEHQVTSYIDQQITCPDCGQPRKQKGKHTLIYRTVFGKLKLQSPRLFHCPCQAHISKSFSPLAQLLTERTSPEYLYLQTKFASLMSYGLSVDLLAEVLPLERQISCSSVRSHLYQLGQRLDDELGEEQYMFVEGCPRDWEKLPRPDLPLVVGIDGGYINGYPRQSGGPKRSFEVIVGKSITDAGDTKSFGFVQTYDQKSKRRLFELLKSQGMQMNQQVTFLSDGGDTVRELQLYLNPQAEHLLDWFHITMRITVLGQYLKGVKHHDAEQGEEMTDRLESIKWYLWHGNVFRALQKIEFLEMDADCLEMDYPKLSKMAKAIREFRIYIENNQAFITNYGERYLWRVIKTRGKYVEQGFQIPKYLHLWRDVQIGDLRFSTRFYDLVRQMRSMPAACGSIHGISRFPPVLIALHLGYVQKSDAETSVLFELIAHRYERKSLLITANQPFSQWDKIFPNSMMTVAAIDRLIHHATIFEMQAESFRKQEAAKHTAKSKKTDS